MECCLDVSSFTQSRAFRGHVVVTTNSEMLPKCLVPVKAQYLSPVDIQPSSIIVSSDRTGDVEEEFRIFTSCPSRLVRVVTNSQPIVRSEFAKDRLSETHSVKIFVAPSSESDIDATLLVELSLFPDQGESVTIKKNVSVYRFKNSLCKENEP